MFKNLVSPVDSKMSMLPASTLIRVNCFPFAFIFLCVSSIALSPALETYNKSLKSKIISFESASRSAICFFTSSATSELNFPSRCKVTKQITDLEANAKEITVYFC